jgi:hypothetical protein
VHTYHQLRMKRKFDISEVRFGPILIFTLIMENDDNHSDENTLERLNRLHLRIETLVTELTFSISHIEQQRRTERIKLAQEKHKAKRDLENQLKKEEKKLTKIKSKENNDWNDVYYSLTNANDQSKQEEQDEINMDVSWKVLILFYFYFFCFIFVLQRKLIGMLQERKPRKTYFHIQLKLLIPKSQVSLSFFFVYIFFCFIVSVYD